MAGQTALIKSELFFPGTVLFGGDYTLWWGGVRVYLCSESRITSDSVWGMITGIGNQIQVGHMQDKCVIAILFLQPDTF